MKRYVDRNQPNKADGDWWLFSDYSPVIPSNSAKNVHVCMCRCGQGTDLEGVHEGGVPVQAGPQGPSLLHGQAVVDGLLQPPIGAVQLHQLDVDVGVAGAQVQLGLQQVEQLVPALLPL